MTGAQGGDAGWTGHSIFFFIRDVVRKRVVLSSTTWHVRLGGEEIFRALWPSACSRSPKLTVTTQTP